MKRRVISAALALCMMLTLLSGTALAAGQHPFTDVPQSHWANEAVGYVYENDLMNGVSATMFQPGGSLTRAMFVTILGRMAGAEEESGESGFADVPAGSWYAPYVNWAAANGIVNGTSATTFDPSGQITREQLAAILYRYTAKYAPDATGNAASLAAYPDAGSVSAYARDAMAWAVGNGLIKGLPHDKTDYLEPGGSTTRAQVATILMRYKQATA